MKLAKQIWIDKYLFELSLESKSVEAHSLMSDESEILNNKLGIITNGYVTFSLYEILNSLIIDHRENKFP